MKKSDITFDLIMVIFLLFFWFHLKLFVVFLFCFWQCKGPLFLKMNLEQN